MSTKIEGFEYNTVTDTPTRTIDIKNYGLFKNKALKRTNKLPSTFGTSGLAMGYAQYSRDSRILDGLQIDQTKNLNNNLMKYTKDYTNDGKNKVDDKFHDIKKQFRKPIELKKYRIDHDKHLKYTIKGETGTFGGYERHDPNSMKNEATEIISLENLKNSDKFSANRGGFYQAGFRKLQLKDAIKKLESKEQDTALEYTINHSFDIDASASDYNKNKNKNIQYMNHVDESDEGGKRTNQVQTINYVKEKNII